MPCSFLRFSTLECFSVRFLLKADTKYYYNKTRTHTQAYHNHLFISSSSGSSGGKKIGFENNDIWYTYKCVFICHHGHTHTHRVTFIFSSSIFSIQAHIRILCRSVKMAEKPFVQIFYFSSFSLFHAVTHGVCVCVFMLHYVLLYISHSTAQHSTQPKYFIYLTFTLFEIKICLWRTAQFHLFSSLPQNIWLRLCECFHLVGMCVRFFAPAFTTHPFYSTLNRFNPIYFTSLNFILFMLFKLIMSHTSHAHR